MKKEKREIWVDINGGIHLTALECIEKDKLIYQCKIDEIIYKIKDHVNYGTTLLDDIEKLKKIKDEYRDILMTYEELKTQIKGIRK